jgi:hypothetical protein
MNIFGRWSVKSNYSNTFRISADSFQNIFMARLLWKKLQIKFLLTSLKSLAVLFLKILPVTLFRKHVPAFLKPPVTLKVVPKAACDSENCHLHSRKFANDSEGKPEQKL